VSRRNEVALVLGWWSIFGLWLTGQNLLVSASAGVAMSLGEAIARGFFGSIVWAGITLLTFGICRNFRLDKKPRGKAIVVHVLVGAAISFGEVVISYAVGRATGWLAMSFVDHFLMGFPPNIVYYWLLVGVGHGLEYYRRLGQREMQNERLQRRLTQAELHLLKSQLQPHFLFNTLHAISALCMKHPPEQMRDIDAHRAVEAFIAGGQA